MTEALKTESKNGNCYFNKMETLKLSEIIGRQIAEIRYYYSPETDAEYSIQSCITFLKLENNWIIDIPIFDDDDFITLTPENRRYFQENFEAGNTINKTAAKLIQGITIEDILFSCKGDEPDFDRSSFIKLSNGYYLTELRYAPNGIPVGPRILNEEEYIKEVKRLNSIELHIRSFAETSGNRL